MTMMRSQRTGDTQLVQYSFGLNRLPHGYEFRRDIKKLGGKYRICRKVSANRARHIALQKEQRLASYRNGYENALTPEQKRLWIGP